MEIKFNKEQMYAEMVKVDEMVINNRLEKEMKDEYTLRRGWTLLSIRTKEAVEALVAKGFTVKHYIPTAPEMANDTDLYMVFWSEDAVKEEFKEQA